MPDAPSETGAVFLSYARDDSESARRIADALRAFGVEVWLDQSELRGGDSWDAKIKTQIRTCALFIPIVSAHTQKRSEGYFRREWKFGVERTHDMASGTAFVVPVVIDETAESGALVPEEFMRFQWTRLPHGVPTSHFIDQVKQLLRNPRSTPGAGQAAPRRQPEQPLSSVRASSPSQKGVQHLAIGTVAALVAAAVVALLSFRKPPNPVEAPKSATAAGAADVSATPSAKSVAVLPFANFSPDKDNEFFADGLQDEVITALAKIHDLKVISRTSVLAYKNPEGRNLKKIGNELGVATVLEGSVQRVGTKVHLNVQLIDARTDDHIWADSYTEDLTDVFSIESALAEQIATALKASLTTDERSLIARRPTQNQEAYDLYLRGRVMEEGLSIISTLADSEAVISVFEQSAAKDPSFSLPHVQASIMHGGLYWFASQDSTDSRRAKDLAELEIAKRLAPSAPETHLAQGEYDYTCLNDWNAALEEYRTAAVALPNDPQVLSGIGRSFRRLGMISRALEEFEKSSKLNPNDETSAFTVVETLFALHRYEKAFEHGTYFLERFPQDDYIRGYTADAQYQVDGDRPAYLKSCGSTNRLDDSRHVLSFRRALLAGDLPAAELEINNPDVKLVQSEMGSIEYPVAVERAYVAFLQGKISEARSNSDEALSAFRNTDWTHRQKPWAHLGIARAEAYQGRSEQAVRDGKAALEEMMAIDALDSTVIKYEFSKILVLSGRTAEALSVLAEVFSNPIIIGPRDVPFDPVWSRLKEDPRLKSILGSVKPL